MIFSTVIFSSIVLIISYCLFRNAAGSMKITKPNMISFIFYVQLVAASYLGSIVILHYDGYINEVLERSQSPQTRYYVWLAISYVMIATPLGMLFAKKIWAVKSSSILFEAYTKKNIAIMNAGHEAILKTFLYILSIISIAAMFYTYYYIGLGTIKKVLASTDPIELLIIRTEIARNFAGNVFIKNIFGMVLGPILSYIAFCYYQATHKKTDLIWFFIMLTTAILMYMHTLAKSTVAFYILGFLFLRVLLHGKIPLKFLLIFFFTFMALLVIAYVFLVQNTDIAYLISPVEQGLVGRILISAISALYRNFDLFPHSVDFLGFSTISKPITSAFGLDYSERSARIVLELTRGAWIESGFGGVLNTLFIGEAWANFGFIGLVLSPFWVGFWIKSLYLGLLKAPKSPIFLGIFTYVSFKSSIMSGFNDYLYYPVLWIIICVMIIVIIFSKRIYQNLSNN